VWVLVKSLVCIIGREALQEKRRKLMITASRSNKSFKTESGRVGDKDYAAEEHEEAVEKLAVMIHDDMGSSSGDEGCGDEAGAI
jgi:hypothetical protein